MNSPLERHEVRLRGLHGERGRVAKPEVIPVLHVVTDDAVVAREGFLRMADAVMEAGGIEVVVHLRAPRMSGRRLWEAAGALRNAAIERDSWVMVNDRADVALAAADGVQVGARGLLPADARRVMGEDRMVGVSVHSVEEARAALAGAPDFLLAGTIWPTPSHPGRPGAGVELIRGIAALGVPAVAIGGVTPGRAAEARDAGAAGVAVLRGVWDAPDPAAAVREYLEQWKG
jgi:thiamine-phosphate pyrophosphorylase